MTNSDEAFKAAQAFQAAVAELADVLPNGFRENGSGGALLATTGSMIPALNGITSAAPSPDKAEIAQLCDMAEAHVQGLPWSIRLRGEPEDGIVAVAAEHGLTTRTQQPFMLLKLDADRAWQESAQASASVRPLGDDEDELFAEVLGAAFGAPPVIIASLYTPLVLSQPFVRAYVAELDGVPAAAGLAILTEEHVGLANIGTVSDYRHLGLGRAVTEAILRDGYAAGARTAYLHSSEEALSLFEHAGFRTAEFWTFFTA
ncbi:GNAT family N-acetyltransferase [Streptomyces sp. NPDC001292]|uniref:GNAT family N-acetyltransferase n=1 Tax=Streptomyces sp. NPDC001292 TaxID=3364558 RepID=UPI003699C0FB